MLEPGVPLGLCDGAKRRVPRQSTIWVIFAAIPRQNRVGDYVHRTSRVVNIVLKWLVAEFPNRSSAPLKQLVQECILMSQGLALPDVTHSPHAGCLWWAVPQECTLIACVLLQTLIDAVIARIEAETIRITNRRPYGYMAEPTKLVLIC